ncbi:TPA: hypothetical protein TVS26_001206 [Streptococcus equi subsp. zooepidemicus]|uniref:hypothetical protein n=1 Tax=Streptococcus equi TaxID=1336 RepID=UPI0013F6075C|nr:hypothetical protein [Streptococcus equi]MCD3462277.1 hypothetical protein [Streptococcus equi subsp. zooepidemicus]HEL0506380.1 hypothetical protein [Streptococcus equi subsp. zooepidemicus]HEL0620411.1 hypothetical protein [Streptococcus equi subsp. zooepidemicus]HEL0624803.1 hypothetical protein [Streptococcus equi subsp. zooepidemicus]HEL0668832.1 hypothetical protein [Streptococcus equi subsp. zooepidemicus]
MMYSRSQRRQYDYEEVIGMGGVKVLQSTLDYINFLESERSRCYKELEENEVSIDKLKKSNADLTQTVIDLTWKDMRRVAKARLSHRKYGVKIR